MNYPKNLDISLAIPKFLGLVKTQSLLLTSSRHMWFSIEVDFIRVKDVSPSTYTSPSESRVS